MSYKAPCNIFYNDGLAKKRTTISHQVVSSLDIVKRYSVIALGRDESVSFIFLILCFQRDDHFTYICPSSDSIIVGRRSGVSVKSIYVSYSDDQRNV